MSMFRKNDSQITVNVANVASVLSEQFDFTVDKLPLRGPDNLPTPFYGLFQSESKKWERGTHCLPVAVKSGYEPHTVDDISAVCEAALTAFHTDMDARITCYWSDRGHEVIIAPSKDYRKTIYGTNDNIFPRIRVCGYFGRTFQVETGAYRDACANLMIARQISGSTVEIRHTSQLRSKMVQLVRSLEATNGAWESFANIAANMEQQRVKVADFISALYPMPTETSGRARTQTENKVGKIISRMLQERQKTGRVDNWQAEGANNATATVWELLNAVTGFVQHDKTRHVSASGSTMGTVERALVGVNDAESIAAWDLALAMAS